MGTLPGVVVVQRTSQAPPIRPGRRAKWTPAVVLRSFNGARAQPEAGSAPAKRPVCASPPPRWLGSQLCPCAKRGGRVAMRFAVPDGSGERRHPPGPEPARPRESWGVPAGTHPHGNQNGLAPEPLVSRLQAPGIQASPPTPHQRHPGPPQGRFCHVRSPGPGRRPGITKPCLPMTPLP